MNELPRFIEQNILAREEVGVFIVIYSIVLLLILVSYIFYALWRLERNHTKEAAVKSAAYDRAMLILEEANRKSYDIVSSANEEAKKILSKADTLDDVTKKDLEDSVTKLSQNNIVQLQKLSEDLLNTYRSVINTEKEKSIETVETLSSALKTEVLTEIDDFKKDLKQETFETEKLVKQKVEAEYADIEKSLRAYKEEKLSSINTSIYEIIVQVSKDVLSKSLSLQDHEDLIVRALENAKKVQEFKS